MKIEKKHNVNVKINPELWRKARIQAIDCGDLTARQIVEEALKVWLKDSEAS
jgi:hypothetical protein